MGSVKLREWAQSQEQEPDHFKLFHRFGRPPRECVAGGDRAVPLWAWSGDHDDWTHREGPPTGDFDLALE